MDGFELVQTMRAQERLRDLPIVILTVREDIASIDRAYAIGATSFATKPVNWRLFSYQLRTSSAQAGWQRPRAMHRIGEAAPSTGRLPRPRTISPACSIGSSTPRT
jgi:PleD family two-component response regulator